MKFHTRVEIYRKLYKLYLLYINQIPSFVHSTDS